MNETSQKTKATFKNLIGYILIPTGLLVLGFSKTIVFPGLERLLGIETLVGKDNVVHQPDGSYYFTNPQAQFEWILSVAILGILICALGFWLSGIKLKFSPNKDGKSDRSNRLL